VAVATLANVGRGPYEKEGRMRIYRLRGAFQRGNQRGKRIFRGRHTHLRTARPGPYASNCCTASVTAPVRYFKYASVRWVSSLYTRLSAMTGSQRSAQIHVQSPDSGSGCLFGLETLRRRL